MSEESKPIGGEFLTMPFKVLAGFTLFAGLLVLIRYVMGIGAVSNLNDGYPWGIWIAYDVVAGTAIACGGYSMALLVYVLNLYWTIFLLRQHPEALKQVLDELDQATGGKDPTPESVEKLTYLESVLKETMRLIPAGVWTARYAMEPFQLGVYQLQKGTWVMLSAYVTHRIPEIFPDPYKFKPERWQDIHPSSYEFMSFSAGPRYCIGQPLA